MTSASPGRRGLRRAQNDITSHSEIVVYMQSEHMFLQRVGVILSAAKNLCYLYDLPLWFSVLKAPAFFGRDQAEVPGKKFR